MRTRAFLLIAVTLSSACSDSAEPVGATPGRPTFDGSLALENVQQQVAFGPRVPGTEGHANQLEWMIGRLEATTSDFATDTFSHVTASGDSLTLVNLLARFAPERSRRILILAHWDTRPISDAATDPALRDIPVPGANDGASGTAVVLEVADILAQHPPPLGVDLLLVDGEDYGPTITDMLLGARHYADQLPPEGSEGRPVYGLLLDMVGDADPLFPVEANSAQYAQVVVRKVWGAAERLGYAEFFPTTATDPITDDHVPLIQAGLPTADLIDFRYGPANSFWHTPQDTPDRLSAATLEMVGEVVLELIFSGG